MVNGSSMERGGFLRAARRGRTVGLVLLLLVSSFVSLLGSAATGSPLAQDAGTQEHTTAVVPNIGAWGRSSLELPRH